MARDSTESRFLEVLNRFGGPQHVHLVGELWDRAESRALLETFLREVFPAELPPGADLLKSKAAGQRGDENGSRCKESSQHGAQEHNPQTADIAAPPPTPERTLHFGLVFFLCRAESVRLRGTSRQLQEILRDVRGRMPAGGAVIGVVMGSDSAVRSDGEPQEVPGEDDARAALLELLLSVFPVKSRAKLCSEVRASVLIPGEEESRREVQRLACEALTEADTLRRLKPKMKSSCFSWRRRRRWNDCGENEVTQEGTALTVLQHPNGDCAETADA
uniref:Uncharacterized protein n=2 Tax=Pyxicephalus adspersus TaxID=30357 RepID=A0AAV3AGD7_PYXAD|nr:TPA: hypothetical protein GDO54_010592 [Pyxicephalus adspersus]